MYFFQVKLSSFDDVETVFYLVPDQQAVDEQGPPFNEKAVTQHPAYKQFLKDTKTNVVDVKYILYDTSAPISNLITEEQFIQMAQDGLLTQLDGNEISISSAKSSKSSSGSGGGNTLMMFFIIGAAALFIIILIVVSMLTGNGSSEDTSSSSPPVTVEATVEAETETTTTSATTETEPTPLETTDPPQTETTEDVYVDTPPEPGTEDVYVDTPIVETAESTTTSSSGSYTGSTSEYSITFSANGGEGELASIKVQPDQYVVLPTAVEASKSLTRKGYKLLGFTESKAINYPLYDYKMPYQNVVLYAVWEAEEYTVTYHSNGGTGQLSATEVKYGDSVPLPTDIAVYKDGYELLGWNTKKNATTPLSKYTMPYEDTTLYAVWGKPKQTAEVTLHYDDAVLIIDEKIGTALNMEQDFGISKEGYIVSGWYFENSPQKLEYITITEDCHVYAKWEKAQFITITVDQSYLNKAPAEYKVALDMTGAAKFTTPVVNDRSDVYNHVDGCTYGFSTKKPTGQFGTIEYYSDTEYKFHENTTLYRVLNEYGGGKGTEADPYIIDYYDQLLRLAENKAKGYFIQTCDIKFPNNVERKAINTIRIGQGYDDKYYDLFVYDGQGYSIKNLKGNTGLFGTVAASTIKNVVIDSASIQISGQQNYGILCNEVTSYTFYGSDKSVYATGNSKIVNCTVRNSKITVNGDVNYIGGIVGSGGYISDCYANSITIKAYDSVAAAGGIVGNACTVIGCIANGVSSEGEIVAAGGIAGAAYGTPMYESGDKQRKYAGSISGCGVRTFITTGADNAGGIVGSTSAIANGGYIKSCYAANIYLNGSANGGVSGGDSSNLYPHTIAYCIIDNTNSYPIIGGTSVKSKAGAMVLTVPADSGLTVDGVLSVLNASGSGYNTWYRSKDINNGYPYPNGVELLTSS